MCVYLKERQHPNLYLERTGSNSRKYGNPSTTIIIAHSYNFRSELHTSEILTRSE